MTTTCVGGAKDTLTNRIVFYLITDFSNRSNNLMPWNAYGARRELAVVPMKDAQIRPARMLALMTSTRISPFPIFGIGTSSTRKSFGP
jgi:hypothetical protein